MGQSSSTQRERENFLQRDQQRFSQLVQERDSRGAQQARPHTPELDASPLVRPGSSRRSPQQQSPQTARPFATFRRRVSAQSIPMRSGAADGESALTRDQVVYEQEERPLVNMEDLGMRNAPIENITASPMPRRPSVMSRLGSRLLPRYSIIENTGEDGERHGEGRTLRRRLSDSLPSTPTEQTNTRGGHRFSMFGPLASGSSQATGSRRRREMTAISRPFPLMADETVIPSTHTESNLQAHTVEASVPLHTRRFAHGSGAPRSSRLARVRRSISTPIENFFSSNPSHSLQDQENQPPPRRPSRVDMADDSDFLLPPLSGTDTSIDLDDRPFDHGHHEHRERGNVLFPTATGPSERAPTWPRWADRAPTGRRESRRMPNLLRGRSSRLIRRDDDAPLSRILQLAAAAIAAQLSGTPEQAINMQALGADGLDGSLHTLFQTLQNATTSTGNEGRATEAGTDAQRTTPPMNFLRVFRFVNSHSETRGTTEQSGSDARGSHARAEHAAPDAQNANEEGTEGRTVTLVLVGVRSVPSGTVPFDDSPTAEPSLDALLSLPIVPSTNLLRGGAGGLLRHADGRSRFTHRRRASMGGVNTFPANYDSQRHQRLHGGSRPNSGETLPTSASSVPSALSESPPGPHPPPSTPADPGLSAYSSGTTTPSREPSSASATNHPPLPRQGSASQRSREAGLFPPVEDQSTHAVRQRRRSDSEFARHRDLGAGAARRNGVVEPDDAPAQGRTWLIYVVGTNLSEDHPAFATPSLFTDVGSVISMCARFSMRLTLSRTLHTRICFCSRLYSVLLSLPSQAETMLHQLLACTASSVALKSCLRKRSMVLMLFKSLPENAALFAYATTNLPMRYGSSRNVATCFIVSALTR